jgi:hypothetical protein
MIRLSRNLVLGPFSYIAGSIFHSLFLSSDSSGKPDLLALLVIIESVAVDVLESKVHNIEMTIGRAKSKLVQFGSSGED